MAPGRLAVTVLFVASAACAHPWTSEDWMSPSVMVQPGSPIVVIGNTKQRAVVHEEPETLWKPGGTHADVSTREWRFHTLDVRTCKAGAIHSFKQGVAVVGWGAAPGELWVRSPEEAPTIRPLEGGGEIEIGTTYAPWRGEPLPVGSGLIATPGRIRVWNLLDRSVRDLPWLSQRPFTRIFSARADDEMVVGLARADDAQSTDVVAVPARGVARPFVTTSVKGPHNLDRSRLLRHGTWLALVPDTSPGTGTIDLLDVRTGTPVVRTSLGFGGGWALVDGAHPRLVRLVGPVGCHRVDIVDLETERRTDVSLPGCVTNLRNWDQETALVIADVEVEGRSVVDLERAPFVVDVERGTAVRAAGDGTRGDFVGAAFYQVDPMRPGELIAVHPWSGRWWIAAKGLGLVRYAVGVPAARRVVIVDEQRRVLTYDVDAHVVRACD